MLRSVFNLEMSLSVFVEETLWARHWNTCTELRVCWSRAG